MHACNALWRTPTLGRQATRTSERAKGDLLPSKFGVERSTKTRKGIPLARHPTDWARTLWLLLEIVLQERLDFISEGCLCSLPEAVVRPISTPAPLGCRRWDAYAGRQNHVRITRHICHEMPSPGPARQSLSLGSPSPRHWFLTTPNKAMFLPRKRRRDQSNRSDTCSRSRPFLRCLPRNRGPQDVPPKTATYSARVSFQYFWVLPRNNRDFAEEEEDTGLPILQLLDAILGFVPVVVARNNWRSVPRV
jgi:hypothetical protein